MKFPTIKYPVKFKEVEVPFMCIGNKTHFSRLTLENFNITDWPVKYGMEHDTQRDSFFYPPNTAEDIGKEIISQRKQALNNELTCQSLYGIIPENMG